MPFLPDLKELKYLRRKLDVTQKELSDAIGIPQATISRIESGKGNPTYSTVKKIFEYLEHKRLSLENTEVKAEDIMTKNIISITSKSKIKAVVELMNKHSLSQIPIIDGEQNLGSITAKKIQKIITDSHDMINSEIDLIKELPFPEVEKNWDIKDISNLLSNYNAVLVKEFGNYIGIITDADLLKYT